MASEAAKYIVKGNLHVVLRVFEAAFFSMRSNLLSKAIEAVWRSPGPRGHLSCWYMQYAHSFKVN